MNNDTQIEYWNGPAGEKWVAQSDRLDAMLSPFANLVLEAAGLREADSSLDIGCGAGALTLKAAQAVGEQGRALGVDISRPLLSLARQRAESIGSPAKFLEADASTFSLGDKADAVISRFGVMFFADPACAFRNIRATLAPGGRITFVCWQSLQLNDWAFAPLRAALPFLKEAPPTPDPNAPGPFAFADRERIHAILDEAGFTSFSIEPHDTLMRIPGKDIGTNADFMMQLGPLSRLLAEQSLDSASVRDALVSQLQEHSTEDGGVVMNAACWIVRARNH